ncbi:MAG: hypothetical protein AAB250_06915, partial [Bdellovibrionota bacterium]
MTRNKFIESIRLFAGLSALALAASACAPAGSDLSGTGANTRQIAETVGPVIDQQVEDEIAANGSAHVHVRAIPSSIGEMNGMTMRRGTASDGEIPPEIISLLARLPEGSFEIETGVEGQPEALGVLVFHPEVGVGLP